MRPSFPLRWRALAVGASAADPSRCKRRRGRPGPASGTRDASRSRHPDTGRWLRSKLCLKIGDAIFGTPPRSPTMPRAITYASAERIVVADGEDGRRLRPPARAAICRSPTRTATPVSGVMSSTAQTSIQSGHTRWGRRAHVADPTSASAGTRRAFSSQVAGRCWPRSGTSTMLGIGRVAVHEVAEARAASRDRRRRPSTRTRRCRRRAPSRLRARRRCRASRRRRRCCR